MAFQQVTCVHPIPSTLLLEIIHQETRRFPFFFVIIHCGLGCWFGLGFGFGFGVDVGVGFGVGVGFSSGSGFGARLGGAHGALGGHCFAGALHQVRIGLNTE